MEAIYSSETLADFQRITEGYIPEDTIPLNDRCENLKPYVYITFFIYSTKH
jgi:hypothetical protein